MSGEADMYPSTLFYPLTESMYQVLGFGEYIEEVYAAYEQHKLETLVGSWLIFCALFVLSFFRYIYIDIDLHISVFYLY